MAYRFAVIRSSNDTDGRLYPLLGHDGESVQPEDWDVDHIQLVSKNLVVKDWIDKKPTQVLRLKDVPTSVIVTRSRLIVSCEQWNKGRRMWGLGLGATVAAATNLERRVRESRQRDGRLLLGHLRYHWIKEVGYYPRQNVVSPAQLRLSVSHKVDAGTDPHTLTVDLFLPLATNPLQLSQTIVRRAAKYRLEHFTVSDEQKEAFETLVSNPAFPEPTGAQFSMCRMPSSYFVNASTAYPER
jgi:hypothetical protein